MKRPFSIGFAFWTFFVVVGSLFPGNNLPRVTWLSGLHIDKFVHLSFYFVMCMLMYFSMMRETKSKFSEREALIVSSTCSVGVGLLMEILQSNLNTGRYFDIFDILANTIGAMLAALVINFKQLK
jgi:VanZ family protein